MARRGIHRFGMAGGRAIAPAIAWCAEMRAALQDPARNADRRLTRIITVGLGAAAGILRHAAGLGCIALMACRPEIRCPLPDIAEHVVDAIAVGGKGADRRGARKPVFPRILVGEIALPGVGHMTSARR